MRISDWSSDVCSSDLRLFEAGDDVAATMQIDEGLVALRAVDNVALRVGQRVVHRNDALVCDFHRSSGELKNERAMFADAFLLSAHRGDAAFSHASDFAPSA